MTEGEIVWWDEERVYVRLVNLGAYMSLVRYHRDGMDYEVLVETNDLQFEVDEYDEDDENE